MVDTPRLMRMIGRRPMRSESRPQTGANRNCMSEYDAMRSVTTAGLAPKCSA
jgi:hypothetical protein